MLDPYDLLRAMGGISAAQVKETQEFMGYLCDTPRRRVHRNVWRTLLIAAVIVSLFTAMCATAYAINLFGLRDLLMPEVKIYHTGDSPVLSMQGLQGSREYMAWREFQTFYDDYLINDYYGDPVPQPDMDEWMQTHINIYFCYTDTLKDKLLALCEKYDLKLRDARYDHSGLDNLSAYIGVDDIITAEGYRADTAGFLAYSDGSFLLQSSIITDLPCSMIDSALVRNVKGYFSQGFLSLPTADTLAERNYTTADGSSVLIVSGGTEAALIYDGDFAFVTMSLRGEEPLPDDVVNAVTDAINFKGLGAASSVNEAAMLPPPEPFVPTTAEQAAVLELVTAQAVGLGESFFDYSSMEQLEITVNEMTLSDNIFRAGWQPEDFGEYSYATTADDSGNFTTYSFPDYLDRTSGELIDGVTLLTVELTVTNCNAADCDIGAGTNVFPYCALNLVDLTGMQNAYNFYYSDCIAFSGAETAPGHGACVVLAPGETLTYRLAYALDEGYSVNSAYLATIPCPIPGVCFIPVSLASVK